MVGLAILLISCLFFIERYWLISLYVSINVGILLFFYLIGIGQYRMHGFLWLNFIICMWLRPHYAPTTLRWYSLRKPLAFIDRYRYTLLLPVLLLQIVGTGIAYRWEWTDTFSNAKAAAAWIRENLSDRSSLFYAGDPSTNVVGVVGYLELERIYYVYEDVFGSYVVWDSRRKAGPLERRDMLSRLLKKMLERKQSAVLISGRPLPLGAKEAGIVELASFTGAIAKFEDFYVYSWALPPILPSSE